VTLPISTKPNPSASIGSITSPSLSNPAATPAGRCRPGCQTMRRVARAWRMPAAAAASLQQRHAASPAIARSRTSPAKPMPASCPPAPCSSAAATQPTQRVRELAAPDGGAQGGRVWAGLTREQAQAGSQDAKLVGCLHIQQANQGACGGGFSKRR
jgi:hypothetical protein